MVIVLPTPGAKIRAAFDVAKRSAPTAAPCPLFAETKLFTVEQLPWNVTDPVLIKRAPPMEAPSPPEVEVASLPPTPPGPFAPLLLPLPPPPPKPPPPPEDPAKLPPPPP